MNDPVMVNSNTYERSAILEYLDKNNNVSPKGEEVNRDVFPLPATESLIKMCKTFKEEEDKREREEREYE
jgi:hypothetical protein